MARPDTAVPKVSRTLAREPLSIPQITERTGLAWSVVRGALDRMEARGEVRREKDVALSHTAKRGPADLWSLVRTR